MKILSGINVFMISRFAPLLPLLFLAASMSGCSETASDYFQGYVEGEYVHVASPLAGRLDALAVSRGTAVAAGDLLFVLEHDNEEAALSEAEQGVAKAENILADLRKGKRPPEITAIEARLEQAQASYGLSREEYERRKALFTSASIPQEEIDRARTEMDRNASLVKQLKAELETAKLAARPDLVDAARSDLEAADYRLQQARWRLAQKSQAAQVSGFVVDTFYQEGEFVPAAYPVLSILPPGNIKIRFFVPETILGSLAIGQKLSVTFDGNGGAVPATITYISPQAEYTPPIIYSRETRSKLVFMIEAVPAAEVAASLHPGQPVDVRLETSND